MRALVELRDKGGRLWLLAVAGDPTLIPGGHDGPPTSLRELADRNGRLTVSGFKVIRESGLPEETP